MKHFFIMSTSQRTRKHHSSNNHFLQCSVLDSTQSCVAQSTQQTTSHIKAEIRKPTTSQATNARLVFKTVTTSSEHFYIHEHRTYKSTKHTQWSINCGGLLVTKTK